MDKKRSGKLIDLAVKLYQQTHSTQKTAKRLGLGPSTTYKMLRAAGVVMPGRHDPEVQERKKSLQGEAAVDAAFDYGSGVPLAEIRAKYGVGTWAIRTAARDCGVELRGQGGRCRLFSEEDKAEIFRLYTEENWTQDQIAVKFHSSQPMIGRLLLSFGVKARGNKARGDKHGSWNGGRVKTSGGYMQVAVGLDDPMRQMADSIGYVLEHRLVMARSLGRPLGKRETVHHVNGDKQDNRLANLQIRFGRHGNGVVMVCSKCGSHEIEYKELQ